jgi:predicted AAA+ superfamily ATPase
LHKSFGELAEHLVAPGIEKRFNELKYHFSETAPKGYLIKDENGRILTEIDILLENGEVVIAVEVKARPEADDIEHHIKRLEILRESRNKKKDGRKILGAIAGAIFEDKVKEAVSKAGFFVIVQSGDTMKIEMPEGFVPKAW